MPSKSALPSELVLSSKSPRPCLPFSFTACMMTAAFRTGFPFSSFTTEKYSHEVGSSSLSFCPTAMLVVPSIASSNPATMILFMGVILCSKAICCHLPFKRAVQFIDDLTRVVSHLLQCRGEDLGCHHYRRRHHWPVAVDCTA